jgi:hypothetical protein
MVTGSIGKDGRVQDFTAGATLPRIKGANEIVVLLGVHSSFALGTFHNLFLLFMKSDAWLTASGGNST